MIPQLGEGLTEARIVALLKCPGEPVAQDEPIFAVETDKANVEIESPYTGMIGEWLVREGQIVPIQAPVVCIMANGPALERHEPLESRIAAPSPRDKVPLPQVRIPPRTRAFCRSLGLEEVLLPTIPSRTTTLLESDVRDYLNRRLAETLPDTPGYQDRALSDRQRTFIRHAAACPPGNTSPIPASVKHPMPWAFVDRAFKAERLRHPDLKFTHFQLMAYLTVQTAACHPKFRSVLIGGENVREFAHVNLGIAVALPDDELATALLPEADTHNFAEFVGLVKARTAEARQGQDQADATMQVVLTYLGNSGITDASPTLVAPAVAVLFIGDKYHESSETLVNLVLTFDHRLINGLGAARFLQSLVGRFQQAA